MRFGLENLFGLNQQALKIHSRRSEVLAGNLANAETPGYKARDIDFKAALQQVRAASGEGQLRTTNAKHLSGNGTQAGSTTNIDDLIGELKFRQPSQPSLDGNTVDPLQEKAAFMENALMYQANLRFLTGKIKELKAALKGE